MSARSYVGLVVAFGLAFAACLPSTGAGGDAGADASARLCRSDRECSAAGLVCDRSRGRCAQCVGDTDCTGGQVCARNECAPATVCSTSRMCPGQVCDPGRGRCVDCVEDVDCPVTDRCEANRCAARPVPCVSDRECSAQGRVCDPGRGFCVECARDQDCPAETFCSAEALCQPTVCAPRSMSCASETRTRVCSANGASFVDAECEAGTRCASGRCVMGPLPDVFVPPPDAMDAGVTPVDVVDPPMDVPAPDVFVAPDVLVLPDVPDVFVPPPDVFTPPACVAPMADCDGASLNGCETDTRTSVAHCGACGAACGGLGARCLAGRCDAVASISAYLYEVCAVREGGAVICWSASRTDQALVPTITDAVEVSVGNFTRCARLRDNTVRCWGSNDMGQLGNGTLVSTETPVAVTGLTDARQLAAGEDFFCALRGAGTVSCWGAGSRGQLGNGALSSSMAPVAVTGITDAVQIAAGRYHACARLRAGGVRCWGDNGYQQLYDGTTVNRAAPVAPMSTAAALEIAVGNYSTYVRTSAGVIGWGYNGNGQLGDGTVTLGTTARTVSTLGANVRALVGGALHACALLDTGSAVCWGGNLDKQLGDGTAMQRLTPVPFMAPTGIQQLAAGLVHTCARYANGSVRCWGRTDTGSVDVPSLR